MRRQEVGRKCCLCVCARGEVITFIVETKEHLENSSLPAFLCHPPWRSDSWHCKWRGFHTLHKIRKRGDIGLYMNTVCTMLTRVAWHVEIQLYFNHSTAQPLWHYMRVAHNGRSISYRCALLGIQLRRWGMIHLLQARIVALYSAQHSYAKRRCNEAQLRLSPHWPCSNARPETCHIQFMPKFPRIGMCWASSYVSFYVAQLWHITCERVSLPTQNNNSIQHIVACDLTRGCFFLSCSLNTHLYNVSTFPLSVIGTCEEFMSNVHV